MGVRSRSEPLKGPRIGVLVVAYNASTTLATVLGRIPSDLAVSDVVVCDDHSDDATYLVGLGYQRAGDLPLTVVRHPRTLGYGGTQKAGYRWAIDHGLDVVALLHADGKYAPEHLPQMVGPLLRDEADAVIGSRMLEPGAARRGRMPAYKRVGHRALSAFQNALVGSSLTDWHSGYRAYRVDALREVPFERDSDGYDFDTELLIQLQDAGKRVVEIPVPSYYGDELRHFNGLVYAKDVVADTVRYRLERMGFGPGRLVLTDDAYDLKLSPRTSHGRILEWMSDVPPGRVLDLGCSSGALGAQLRKLGHHVTGVDVVEREPVRDRVDELVVADLEDGLPVEVGVGFDRVVAADVLEHVRAPERLLAQALERLAPGGAIVASVPNFSHWYPRLRTALGAFDYDRRGILDAGHLRFFTARSFERLAADIGLAVARREAIGLPLEVVARGGRERWSESTAGLAQRADDALVRLRPSLFAYQLLYELRPVRDGDG